ncbi:MAG TPA: SpoIIE family protein phosphatase [Blastocatellia bacterium]|nr:SpoIIE family protein phosphatase [Blastocatellia bacterium]
MSRPRVSEHGDISIESVEALSRQDLSEWVHDRLHGRDVTVPGDRGGMPHYLLALIYPKLDRATREDLQLIVMEFLRDLVRNGASEWSGEAGDELLMLVEPVLGQSPRRDEAVDLLLGAAKSGRLRTNTDPDLHHRALQVLVELHHRAERSFWQRQFELGGPPYAPTALEGLSLVDASAALKWLTSIRWNEAVEDAIIGLLPSLLEDYGAAKITSLLENVWSKLDPAFHEPLRRYCSEEGLTLMIQEGADLPLWLLRGSARVGQIELQPVGTMAGEGAAKRRLLGALNPPSPQETYRVPEFGLEGSLSAAGPDYYHVKKDAQGSYRIYVGDVCGHGLASALLVQEIHGLITVLQEQDLSPEEICAQLHSKLCERAFGYRQTDAADPVGPSDRWATLVCEVLNPRSSQPQDVPGESLAGNRRSVQ